MEQALELLRFQFLLVRFIARAVHRHVDFHHRAGSVPSCDSVVANYGSALMSGSAGNKTEQVAKSSLAAKVAAARRSVAADFRGSCLDCWTKADYLNSQNCVVAEHRNDRCSGNCCYSANDCCPAHWNVD
jgi:hypothetical protein